MATNPEEPAFPQHGWSSDPDVIKRMTHQGGLTKREEIAKAAMLGLLSAGIGVVVENVASGSQVHSMKSEDIADAALQYAAALIAALNKTAEVKPEYPTNPCAPLDTGSDIPF